MILHTRRLRLIPADAALVRADLAGPAALASALGLPLAPGWPPEYYDAPAMQYALVRLEEDPESSGWWLRYLVVPDQCVAGIAGYKGAPAPDGTVEVGYSVVPAYQGQGFAAEAVAGLVERAFEVPEVTRVIAETRPALLPSIRVLEKNGFRLVGEGREPGVIRFEVARADFAAGHRSLPDHLRHFLRLLGHQSWADRRALDAIEHADPADPAAMALFAHVLGAEHVWLSRLRGTPAEVAVWPNVTAAQCRELAMANELGLREFLFGLDRTDLRRLVRYTNSAGEEFSTAIEDVLLHLFLHGMYHRGQVAQRLRLTGQQPATTDYIAFARGAPAATRAAR